MTLRALHELDVAAFQATARSGGPIRDATLPRLTHAADHSKLWLALAVQRLSARHPR